MIRINRVSEYHPVRKQNAARVMTKNENYFSGEFKISNTKVEKALRRVGELVARELSKKTSPQNRKLQRGKE